MSSFFPNNRRSDGNTMMTTVDSWSTVAAEPLPRFTPRAGGNATSATVAPPLNRSMAALQAANQTTLSSAGPSSMGGGYGGIPPLTFNNTQNRISTPWNAAPLQLPVQQQQPPRNPPSSSVRVEETVEEMLARREQELLDKMLKETEEATQKETQRLLEEQLSMAWENDRNLWLQEVVGTRTLGGAARGGGAAPLGMRLASGSSTTTDAFRLMTTTKTPTTTPHHHATRQHWGGTTTPLLMQQAAARNVAPVEAEIIQAHGEIIARLSRQNNQYAPQQAAAAFVERLEDMQQQQTSRAAMTPGWSGYITAWKWAQTLLEQCPPSAVFSSSPDLDKARGTVVHLTRQYEALIRDRVHRGTQAGQDVNVPAAHRSAVATQCSIYAKLVLGDGALTASPWPVVYYCLRCGCATAALQVWQSLLGTAAMTGVSEGVRLAVERVLSVLEQQEGGRNGAYFWEAGIPRLDLQDSRALFEAMESTTPDLFRSGVLALLSGMAPLPSSQEHPGFATIEDYLLGRLWMALLQPDPMNSLAELGGEIYGFGPNYFGDNQSGGWAFTLPLLMSQQHAKALYHLANVGNDLGLLQAAHLVVVLSAGQIDVTDAGHSPSDGPTDTSDLVPSLLVAYSHRLLAHPSAAGGPLAALEYLVRIPHRDRAKKEVASMIAKTRELTALAGAIDNNGERHQGQPLDNHFSPAEVSDVLREAAELLISRSSDQRTDPGAMRTAVLSFMLAGRYASVLTLLIEMVSPPHLPDEHREHWLEQLNAFHSFYIAKPTKVVDVLKRDGSYALVETSRMIYELNVFFRFYRDGRYGNALELIKRLELLPTFPSEMATMESKYAHLDESIKRTYPFVLVATMEMQSKEHERIKSQLGAASGTVARERLQALEESAKRLVTFASTVGVPQEQMQRLSRIQALLV